MTAWKGGAWNSQRGGLGPWRGGPWLSQRGGGTNWDNVSVGDYVEGGVYGGVIEYADSRKFHIILGLQASEDTAQWKNSRTSTSGTGSQDDGFANTQAMILAGAADHPSAVYCANYVDGEGNNDYYLPARNELTMAQDLADAMHAEFSAQLSTLRWSSSQSSADHAWCRRLSDGGEWQTTSSAYKTNVYIVRPIRRVPV